MTSDYGTPFVSDALVSIDIDDVLQEVRSVLDHLAPSYLVVTDHSPAEGVFVLDVDSVLGLVDDAADEEDVLGWTGADLVRELAVEPSLVINLVTDEGPAEPIPGGLLERILDRHLVVTVDDRVRAVIGADAHVEGAAPRDVIDELRVHATATDHVEVTAVSGSDHLLLAEPPARPSSVPVGVGDDDEAVVTGLQVLVPGQVPFNGVVSLLARLIRREDDDLADIEFFADVGDRISVVVWPQEGVQVEGADTKTLTVSEDGADEIAEIKLKITSAERASLVVEAYRDQTSLGSALVELRVVLGGGVLPPTQRAAVLPLGRGHAPRSDLAVHIVEGRDSDGDRGLRFVAIEPGHEPVAFPFRKVPLDAHGYLAPLFERINTALGKPAPGQPPPTTSAEDVVRDIGLSLALDLLPPKLMDFLWQKRDEIRSIVVHSEEGLLPWELCLVTHRGADGRTEELGYLCELFELTRWRPMLPAREELTMSRFGVIAPDDSGLKSRKSEVEMLNALGTDARSVELVRATSKDVMKVLTDGTYDVIHFIGHGELQDPGRAASARLVLSGASFLVAESIRGAAANFGLASPLVFLNACRLGSASAGLVGPAGFASVMLDAGSAAFVGAHWDVVDEKAHEFATTLYAHLVNGEPIGRAALAARLAIKNPDDPTWLAYTVFASPTAALAASPG